ncbi:hypothetical protein Dimus_012496 [Dionaea muscipula]
MDKRESPATLSASFQKLDLNSSTSNITKTFNATTAASFQFPVLLPFKRTKPPSLISLCLTVVGKHLEDVIPDLGEIAISFPADIKMAIAAIARRRKLLNDEVIISLADASWEILDISCSEVTDFGLQKVSEMCTSLLAVDISRCSNITPLGVSQLVQHCHALQTLRCGGCPRSDNTARRSLGLFKPNLNDMEGDSWEELDTTEITQCAGSLQWLVWPRIGSDLLESFSAECPRVEVNPKPLLPFGLKGIKGIEVPREALPDTVLDERILEEIDPSTWSVFAPPAPKNVPTTISTPSELSVAEKFRLAFVERDTRLAPKRAKNARQHQRRAEREWMMTSAEAKAIVHASRVTRSHHSRN